jgi:arginase
MPLAMITGRGEQEILARTSLTPLSDDRVGHVGARDLEPGERETLRNSGIMLSSSLREAASKLPPASSVWIHFDTDYVNPLDAPAMRYPTAGGPRAQEVRDEFAAIGGQYRILGLSISAWAPHLDDASNGSSTAEVCWQIVSAISNL